VSLLELVSIPNTRPVWPAEFASLVSKCEQNPDDRTPFGVLADWCDERGEVELGRAWRWLSKRTWDESKGVGVQVLFVPPKWGALDDWEIRHLPLSLQRPAGHAGYCSTLAARVADLAKRLAEVDREVQA
jgi:hypothetical protein